MCRLGGVVMTNRPRTVEFYDDVAANILALLTNMEAAFGGDGVSITFHYPDGRWHSIKEHRRVHYIYSRYQDIRDSLEGATIVQMHARKATRGSSLNLDNLHPFHHAPVVGCHNGVIQDNALWASLKNQGIFPYSDVDSEAIFAALSLYAPTLRPKSLQKVVDELYGSFAITAVSTERPNTLMLLASDNPLCFYHDKKRGIVWYASTEDLLPEEVLPTPKTKKVTEKGKTKWVKLPVTTKLEEGDVYFFTAEKKRINVKKAYVEVWSNHYHYYSPEDLLDAEDLYRAELEDWLNQYMGYSYMEMKDLSIWELEDLVDQYRRYFERIEEEKA